MSAEPLVRLGGGAAFRLGNRPLIAAKDVLEGVAPAGLTIDQIVDAMIADGLLEAPFRPFVHVWLDAFEVPRAKWSRIRPKAAATLTICVLPMGGGGGSSAGRIIAMIAIVALAAYTGGAALSALSAAGASAGVAAAGAALASAAVAMAGNLLVNAIIPIKQPDQQARKARYSLTGASNQARPHDPVPVILGRRRTFPPRCANPYTVMIGQDVYLRCMMQPSVSWVDRENVKIGETPISGFDGVTINWHTRPDDAAEPLWFSRVVAEDPIGVPVKNVAGWMTRAAPIAATDLHIDVGFQGGLYEIKKSSGQPSKVRTVQIEVRYGPRGGDPAAATAAPVGPGGVVSYTMAVPEAWRATLAWTVPAGDYDIHVRRLSADQPDGNTTVSDVLTWVCIRAFGDDSPLADPANTPWVEIEVKASDQLNGVLDTFNFVATSLVQQATADGPAGPWIASRNPADLFLAASMSPFSDMELDADERNLAEIADWRALCEAEGWTCDLAEDQEQSVGELLLRIATCGLARPTMGGGALSVVVDWAKPAGLQIFTARNVSKFRGSLIYPTEVHGLRLRFQNAAKDYDDDTVIVFAAGFNEGNATLYDSIDIRDKCVSAEVEALGLRILAQRILRPESFVFDQDVEHVVVREGDRALLAHPVALVGQVAGRVVEVVTRAGGAEHGVILDELVIMEAGKSYALAWRSTAGAFLSTAALATEVGQGHTVWFAVVPGVMPDEGDLVSVGEQSIETVEVLVNRITPKPGLKAEIECVPYAPELQTLDPGDVVIYRSGAARPPALPGAAINRRDERAAERLLTEVNARAVLAAGWAAAAVSDGVITISEKRDLVPRLKAMLDGVAVLGTLGDASPQRTAYLAAITALNAVLASLVAPSDWDDMTDDTNVPDPTAFWQAVRGVESAERDLRSVLTAAALSNNSMVPEARLVPLLKKRIEAIDTSVLFSFATANRAIVNTRDTFLKVREELTVRLDAADAAIVSEKTVRSTATEALAQSIATVGANYSGFAGLVASEALARSNGDSANASLISTVSATATANTTAITTLGGTVSGLSGSLSTLSSTVTSLSSAVATGDSTNATAITNVSSRLNNISGSGASVETILSTHASALGALDALWMVRVQTTAGGRAVVGGIGVGVSGGTSQIAFLADEVVFADPDDPDNQAAVFEVIGGQLVYKNTQIKALAPDNLSAGTTGTKVICIDENAMTFNSTAVWSDVITVGPLTPPLGYPIDGLFAVACTNASGQTDALFRIIRDDATVIAGGAGGGFPMSITNDGQSVTLPFADVVDAGRSTSWTLQARKRNNTEVVTCRNRYGKAELNPRATYQQFSITPDSGGGGAGPGGGGGGGGVIP